MRTPMRNGRDVVFRPNKNGKRPQGVLVNSVIRGDRMIAAAPQMSIKGIQSKNGHCLAVIRKIKVHTVCWTWPVTFRSGRVRWIHQGIQSFAEEISAISAQTSLGVLRISAV